MKVKVLSAILSRFYMFCAYTRLRYQVRVYRTIGPLVYIYEVKVLIVYTY